MQRKGTDPYKVGFDNIEKARRFPPAPGGQIICANKSAVAYRPAKGRPDAEKGEAYGVWCYLSISIARDRARAASLFIEDVGNRVPLDIFDHVNIAVPVARFGLFNNQSLA